MYLTAGPHPLSPRPRHLLAGHLGLAGSGPEGFLRSQTG